MHYLCGVVWCVCVCVCVCVIVQNNAIFLSLSSTLHTDTCYILSFAIIMLNTTLHNANVKHKVSSILRWEGRRGWREGGSGGKVRVEGR